jgi:hypothetical protein
MALPMAAGAPRLALAPRAPLLPCATLALGPFGHSELRIGADFAADALADPLPVIALRTRGAMRPALREARRRSADGRSCGRRDPAADPRRLSSRQRSSRRQGMDDEMQLALADGVSVQQLGEAEGAVVLRFGSGQI